MNLFRRHFDQTVLLGAAFAALIVMVSTAVWLVKKSTDDFSWVTHSSTVQNQLLSLQLAIRRAEGAQRGYLLSSDPTYLGIYQTSADFILPRLEELQKLVSDNPVQSMRAANLATIVRAKHDELLKIADLLQKGRGSEVRDIIAAPAGQDLMAAFTTVSTGIRDSENGLFAERTARTHTTNQWLLATSILAALVILIIATISILLIRRSTEDLRKAQAELRETNAHLEEKVEERTADLTEANNELQRFAYIVSHDLRSPLVNIMGFTGELDAIRRDLLEQETGRRGDVPVDPRKEAILQDFDEAIGFIKSSIGKMDRLIRSILDLSRAGRRDFKVETLDLNRILATIRDGLAHQAQAVGATIELGPLPQIENDRVAIEQIFSNLLDNAVKYLSSERAGRISVTSEERIGFAIIRVADNGRGIDASDRDRVFELFRRAGVQDTQGEGIGLAHVRALVRRMGGNIRLESEPGQGSTFTVILPKHWKQ